MSNTQAAHAIYAPAEHCPEGLQVPGFRNGPLCTLALGHSTLRGGGRAGGRVGVDAVVQALGIVLAAQLQHGIALCCSSTKEGAGLEMLDGA